jgi:aryl-alcohol dehydrogenase-like predicted oxidoreductase
VSSVITGATRVEQVQENMKALDFVDSFTPGVISRIDEIFN